MKEFALGLIVGAVSFAVLVTSTSTRRSRSAEPTTEAAVPVVKSGPSKAYGVDETLIPQDSSSSHASADGFSLHDVVDTRDEPDTKYSICVFCGSSTGANPAYAVVAEELGRLLASQEISLVYGGGSRGLMGVVASATDRHSGKVFGVIPQALIDSEAAEFHIQKSRLQIVRTMHERKRAMADKADAFIALPGGFGTMEELLEMITWTQLSVHRKSVGLLNVDGFFDSFLLFVDRAINDGFIDSSLRSIIVVEENPRLLLQRILIHIPPSGYQMNW